MADKTTTYGLRIKAESNAPKVADEIAALQKHLAQNQDAVKRYGAALRNLKGDSDAVTETKKKLKAQLAAARDGISQNTLALVNHNAQLSAAKGKTEEASGVMKMLGLESLTAAGAVAALGAAYAGIVVAVVGATFALGKWIVEQGNELRTQGLFREAATGSAENAKAFGNQIEALATKVPTSRAELNKLSVDMSRLLVNTRVSGQGIVDTFNAVAQTSAAMGDSAGGKIQEVIERSKMMGRMGLGINELQGTGIDTRDVAGQLAKNLHIGLAAARQQLAMGRVNVNDGAKAIRDVVEKRFGPVNSRRMLDLNVIGAKLKDNLAGLTKDVNLEKLLEGLSKMADLFSQNTVTGQMLKRLVTDFGNAANTVFGKSGPMVETFVGVFTVEMLKFELAALKAAVFIKEKFGVDLSKSLDDTSIAVFAAKTAFTVLAAAVVATAVGIAAIVSYAIAVKAAIDTVRTAIKGWFENLGSGDWQKTGLAIMQGLAAGISGGSTLVGDAVVNIAGAVKGRFKEALGIHSPSVVFEGYGKQTAEGYRKGVETETPATSGAIAGMVAPPSVSFKGGGGGGPSSVSLSATIHVDASGAKSGAEVAQALSSPAFKAQFTKMVEEMLVGTGLLPQNPRGAS